MFLRGVITQSSEYALQMRKDDASDWFPGFDSPVGSGSPKTGGRVICIVPPTPTGVA